MVTTGSPDFLTQLARERLLVIIRGADAEAAVAASLALLSSGIRFLEISLVSADALAVIAEVARLAPHGAVIGAGTVLTRNDVARAVGAGARFMVTPALTESVAESVAGGIPVLAGVLTPTEALTAMGQGADAVKLFPAPFGGPSYLRALSEPLPDLPFIPVGGVDVGLASEYFRAGAVAVGVGSALLGDAIRGGDLGALRTRAAAFVSVAERSGGRA